MPTHCGSSLFYKQFLLTSNFLLDNLLDVSDYRVIVHRANLLGHHMTLGIDEYAHWNGTDRIALLSNAGKVKIQGECEAVILHKAHDLANVRFNIDKDKFDAIAVFLICALELRELAHARRTPCRPEIDDDRLARQRGQLYAAAFRIDDRKIGSHYSTGGHGFLYRAAGGGGHGLVVALGWIIGSLRRLGIIDILLAITACQTQCGGAERNCQDDAKDCFYALFHGYSFIG